MGIAPADALNLTLWQYEATLVEWNRAHMSEGEELEPMGVDVFQDQEQFFADNPHLMN